MKKKDLKAIARYCAEDIADYELRVQVAIGLMDRMRCPLSQADPSLCDSMQSCAEEWAEENEVELDEDFDVEDVLWVE